MAVLKPKLPVLAAKILLPDKLTGIVPAAYGITNFLKVSELMKLLEYLYPACVKIKSTIFLTYIEGPSLHHGA